MGPIRHFPRSTIQTLIKAKNGPNPPKVHPRRECVDGVRNVLSLAAIRIEKKANHGVDGLAAIFVE